MQTIKARNYPINLRTQLKSRNLINIVSKNVYLTRKILFVLLNFTL